MKLPFLARRVPILDTHTVKLPPKLADDFYLSRPWRVLIAKILKVRGRACQDCGRRGCRVYGDHIKEIKDGGAPLDPGNVRLLCGSCHTLKTNAAKRARGAMRYDEEPNESPRGSRADTREPEAGLHAEVGRLHADGNLEGSSDFDRMLEDALQGRAKKAR